MAVMVLSVLGTAAAADATPAPVSATNATPAAPMNHSVSISNSISPALRDCYHPSKQPYPNQNCTLINYLARGSTVTLVCQTAGQTIGNDSYWDYVQTGYGYGYVTDEYVNNPYAPNPPFRDASVPLCNY